MHVLREFRDDTRGTATIEFVILFPVVMSIFFIGIETGIYMLRSAMLERGVDLSLREVRLNSGTPIDYDDLKQTICDETGIVANCVDNLQIELRPIPTTAGTIEATVGSIPRCIDIDSTDPAISETNYDTASGNSLMFMRACLLARPFFPSAFIGTGLSIDSQGNYAIVVSTAFVNQPQDGSAAAEPTGTFLAPIEITEEEVETTTFPPEEGETTPGSSSGGGSSGGSSSGGSSGGSGTSGGGSSTTTSGGSGGTTSGGGGSGGSSGGGSTTTTTGGGGSSGEGGTTTTTGGGGSSEGGGTESTTSSPPPTPIPTFGGRDTAS